ncbi:MAG: GGDEF domain-containing protein [Desulfurivibrionaceae bacterium]|nr:GGDEF domain-containing protein [Desulfurivibrionaceae bacterium]
MDAIKKAVLSCLRDCGPDDNLEAALARIIDREGDAACKVVLEVLTHFDFDIRTAVCHWQEIVAHQSTLMELLQRPVTLAVAVCDYFQWVKKTRGFPKLVEVFRFEEICYRNQHDSLTGLHNRESFEEALIHEMASAKRHGHMLSLLFMDIDSFKVVNDTHGHLVGDRVLRAVGEILLASKRAMDLAARYGGDEFLLLLPDTDKREALILVERIQAKVADYALEGVAHPFGIKISCGVATFPDDAAEVMALKQYADDALYRTKRSDNSSPASIPSAEPKGRLSVRRQHSCPGRLCPALQS